jgi:hypothetical protein
MEGIIQVPRIEGGGEMADLEARIQGTLQNLKKNISWLENQGKEVKEKANDIYLRAFLKVEPLFSFVVDPSNPDSALGSGVGFLAGGAETLLDPKNTVAEGALLMLFALKKALESK